MNPATRRGWVLLLGDLRTQPQGLARVAGWAALEALPALLGGHLVARAIDDGFLAGRSGAGLGWLAALLGVHGLAALATRSSFPALASVVEPVRDATLERVVSGTLHRASAGVDGLDAAAVSRLTQQVETVRDVLAGLLMNLRRVLFTVLAATAGLLTLDPAIAVLTVPAVIGSLVLFGCLMRTLIARQRAVVLADETVASSAGTAVAGARDVAACGAVELTVDRVGRHMDASAAAARAMGRGAAARNLTASLGAYLPLILVLAWTPWLLRRGATAGEIVGAVTYVTAGLEPAVRLATQTVGASGLRLAVTLRRLAEASAPSDVREPEHPATPDGYELRLARVTFAYGPRSEPVLHELDLTVPSGSHLAIVGSSGIGKSTLANLLAGTLRPDRGEIRLGDAPLDAMATADVRRAVTLIPQEAYVFAGTIRENLCYLRPHPEPAALDQAVDEVGLRPLVDRLGGYDANLAPTDLSAGECQLVALARAYLSEAEVLILDEATCHLDPVAEARAENAFVRRSGTLIVIAHRISSARRAGRVLLLDGTRAYHGTHDDLLGRSSRYAELVGHWNPAPAPEPIEAR
ncbi:ABC transporter ATP-binding protein [Virgisporangium aurantiacum]|uniref:ABC transporter ATP-binding protein n=1 Tax=Virgisporangium aurantiacum TaxID=175570 RepID=A0A8J4E6D2_9ACTN|nr:ABC transporter ATP-binding protein [Virgisporangium aurantiacum]GIJ63955.1 ABC transporter ATP-binding protein [Virgisporangium aurantiacum]